MDEQSKEGKFSWEGSMEPILKPKSPKKNDSLGLTRILLCFQMSITFLLFAVGSVILFFFRGESMGDIYDGMVLLTVLLLFSGFMQLISLRMIKKRRHHSIAFAGATFGLYFIPISLVIIILLIMNKKEFK